MGTGWNQVNNFKLEVSCILYLHVVFSKLIRGEPERAPNTRGTGSGFIYICLWGDHFSEERVKF